jgi:Protein of unknown function (DUF3455)
MKRLLAAVAMPLSLSLACATPPMPKAHEAIKPGAFAPPVVPGNLQVPAGVVPAFVVEAKGVQIYVCKGKEQKAAPETDFKWTFKAPEAQLFDAGGELVGKHYAGPTWEWRDGSQVVGEVKEKDTPSADAIPWLLLAAKSNTGNGALSGVTYIQRTDTKGGNAPSAGCDRAADGQQARIDYSARYYFYSSATAPAR